MRRANWALLSLLASGAVLRLALIARSPGISFDVANLQLVALRFVASPLHTYDVNLLPAPFSVARWPYPPAALPLLALIQEIARTTGVGFSRLVRLPLAAADLGICLLVYVTLAARGESRRRCLSGAALVALGPCFFFVSAVHGQIDALAWLPGVAAVALWERNTEPHRALLAGLLIGIGAAVKTVPILLVIALLPTARTRREASLLLVSAVALPLLALLPFFATTPDGLRAVRDYRGVPGYAGLSLFAEPKLSYLFFRGAGPAFSSVVRVMRDNTTLMVAGPILAVGAVLWHRRVPAARGAAALLLIFYVFSPIVLPQYFLWAAPFLLLAGYQRATALYQLVLLPVLVASYLNQLLGRTSHFVVLNRDLLLYVYVPLVAIATLGFAVGVWLLVAGSGPSWRTGRGPHDRRVRTRRELPPVPPAPTDSGPRDRSTRGPGRAPPRRRSKPGSV